MCQIRLAKIARGSFFSRLYSAIKTKFFTRKKKKSNISARALMMFLGLYSSHGVIVSPSMDGCNYTSTFCLRRVICVGRFNNSLQSNADSALSTRKGSSRRKAFERSPSLALGLQIPELLHGSQHEAAVQIQVATQTGPFIPGTLEGLLFCEATPSRPGVTCWRHFHLPVMQQFLCRSSGSAKAAAEEKFTGCVVFTKRDFSNSRTSCG